MASISTAGTPHADCIKAVQSYINKILRPKDATRAIDGMKALLLDRETKTIVSMVYSMHEILSKEVYLVETLEAPHNNMTHMAAVCLLRPLPENVRALAAHLKEPKFKEYHIFFTNIVTQETLRKLADADHLQVVKQVQEFYSDFYAVNPELFTLNLQGSLSLSRPRSTYGAHESAALARSMQGLLSLLLSLKMKPYVRFQASSEAAQMVAREITGAIAGERDLFTFARQAAGAPLLLVLDRRDDPVTPLLSQWTYQAMVHELLPGGIKNNTVDMRHAKGVSKDLEQIVLAPSQDEFFRSNMYANYGDLGAAVKAMLDDYTKSRGGAANISSIADMQRFVEAYPELKSKGLAVGKHVALMSEIAAAIESRHLLDVSEQEQNVACSDGPNDQFKAITELLKAAPIDSLDALRLLMLYTLRYERSRPDRVAELRRFVVDNVSGARDSVGLVDTLLAYGGAGVRGSDLFGSGNMLSKLSSQVRRGLNGVTNVFTQHEPHVVSLLDQLARGKLTKAAFPYVGAEPPQGKFSTVVVFIVGGATFEESAKVAAINSGQLQLGGAGGPGGAATGGTSPGGASGAPPFKVVLGGTTILNSGAFLAELKRMHDGGVAIDVGGGGGSGSGAGTGM